MLALMLAVAAATASLPGDRDPLRAPPEAASGTARMDPVTAAELLLSSGQVDDARKLLAALVRERPADLQVRFLLGLVELQSGRYAEAVRHFREITGAQPDNVRARLEMGRAYFLAGDYLNADRQFRFARAGRLPPAVARNVDRFLNRIRQLKRFSFDISLGLAPDTNLNAGPAIDTVTLYGIPFQLDDAAQKQSGVGLLLEGGVEWAPPIADRVKWRVGIQGSRSQYRDGAFNDTTGLVYTGPHVALGRWDLDVYALGQRRWFGGRRYMSALGGTAAATRYFGARTALSASVTRAWQTFPLVPDRSGTASHASLALAHRPTPSSILTARASIGAQDARVRPYASHDWQLGLAYSRELPGGLTAGLGSSFASIDYRAPLQAFDRTRHDRLLTVSANILSRRIHYRGFAPRLAYTYTKNFSNLELYAFDRHRIELTLTRSF